MVTVTAAQAATTFKRMRVPWVGDPLLLLSVATASVLLVMAVIGPWITLYDPAATDILAAGQGPSAAHLLGTDSLGRDILCRALTGARLRFAGPGLIVLASASAGTALALLAAWSGGRVDRLLNRGLTIVFAIPGVLVAVLASAVFGAGFWAPVIALSIVYVPYVARVVRSVAIRERHLPYIEALQLAGMSTWRICTRHLLRNLAPIVLAQATIGFGAALMDFGAVSFLGLGVQAPQAEWGLMVADGRSEVLDGAIWQSVVAGLLIVITVITFNVLGERLARRFGAPR